MDFGKILARGLVQLGIGGPSFRSSGGQIEVRNPANNGYAGLAADTLSAVTNLAGTTLLLTNQGGAGSKRLTVGTTPLASPADGDLFLEINSSNFLPYGWIWSWNGNYWLSPEERRPLSFDNISALTRGYFDCDQGLDVLFSSLLLNGFVATTNNGTANWSAQLERVNNGISVTAIGSAASSSAQSADAGFAVSAPTNVHVDVSAVIARQFRVTLYKNNSPGNFFGGATAIFRYARP